MEQDERRIVFETGKGVSARNRRSQRIAYFRAYFLSELQVALNRVVAPDALQGEAATLARSLADGPTFAHGMTKALLHREWSMDLDAAIDAEAEAQAICMATGDFRRAYDAFVAKTPPRFEGS